MKPDGKKDEKFCNKAFLLTNLQSVTKKNHIHTYIHTHTYTYITDIVFIIGLNTLVAQPVSFQE